MGLIWPVPAVAIPPLAMTPALQQHLQAWLQEDLGRGDLSAAALQGCRGQAHWLSKADGVFCGGQLAAAVFGLMDSGVSAQVLVNDGEAISAGTRLLELEGPAAALVGAERTALNLAMRLSGIATATRRLVDLVAGTRAAICETRKTLPGLRGLQKYAVHCGGGRLHRFGLFDAALFKDNHLATMRSLGTDLEAACRAARAMGPIRFVEVEVDTLDQLDTVLSFESGVVDIILLDNMPPEMMAEAVRRRDDRRPTVELEASGGISEATIQAVAQSGVDRISVGALTHSVQNLDLGFDL